MNGVHLAALFIAVVIFIGNIAYDKALNKAPVNWKRTGISVAVVIALVYLIEWIAETGLDIGSQ